MGLPSNALVSFHIPKRVATAWNVLPGVGVEADMVVIFKRILIGTRIYREWKDTDHVQVCLSIMLATEIVG